MTFPLLTRLAFFMAFAVGAAAPAQAGFEWKPPAAPAAVTPQAPAASHDAAVTAAPAEVVESMELTPIPGMMDRNVIAADAPRIDPVPMMRPSGVFGSNNASGPRGVVEGFGSDIPLALVMSQVVPAAFSYSFDPGVNPGMMLSWQGGKPWDVVLSDAVSVHGLNVLIAGNTVRIAPKGVAPSTGFPQAIMKTSADTAAPEKTMAADALAQLDAAMETATVSPDMKSYPRRVPPEKAGGVPVGKKPSAPAAAVDLARPTPPVLPMPASISMDTQMGNELTAYEPAASGDVMDMGASVEPVSAPADIMTPVALTDANQGPAREDVVIPMTGGVMNPAEIRFWEANAGESLKNVLSKWSEKAGVNILWDSSFDYKIPAEIKMHGTFPDAVTQILSVYGGMEPRPLGRLHPNLPAGPSVLLIENYP